MPLGMTHWALSMGDELAQGDPHLPQTRTDTPAGCCWSLLGAVLGV